MLKYQNMKIFFAKGYVSNWSDKVLMIKKNKSNAPFLYVISDLKGEKIV